MPWVLEKSQCSPIHIIKIRVNSKLDKPPQILLFPEVIALIFFLIIFKNCFWCPHFAGLKPTSNPLLFKGQRSRLDLCCPAPPHPRESLSPIPHYPRGGPCFSLFPPPKGQGTLAWPPSPPDPGLSAGSRWEDREALQMSVVKETEMQGHQNSSAKSMTFLPKDKHLGKNDIPINLGKVSKIM